MSERIRLGWRGGVNLIVAPKALRDDQLANGKNCWPVLDGQLAKREPMVAERLMISDGAVYIPLTMFRPDATTGFEFIIHFTNLSGVEGIAAGTFHNESFGSFIVQYLPERPDKYRPVVFVNYNGAVIAVVAGMEGFYQLVKNGNGVWVWSRCYFNYDDYFRSIGSMAPSIQPQAINVKPKVACVYRGRMHYFNFGPGMENWMVVADRSDYQLSTADYSRQIQLPISTQIGPDVLAANGRHFVFAAIQGEEILAAEECALNGVQGGLETALLIRTNKSAIICTGELAESTDDGTTFNSYLGDFRALKINFDCGVFGAYATCRAPNGTFWANQDDVYVIYDGEPRPRAIGTNIRPALQAVPPNLRRMVHMAYAGGAVYLSIPSPDSTNEIELVVHHWRLDLRPWGDGGPNARPSGPNEASWWGPMDYVGAQALGGSATGRLGTCIVERDQTLYGMFFGDINVAADRRLHLVSFNKGVGGRDVPYVEVSSGNTWEPNTNYVMGDVVMPTPLVRNGRLYVCTVEGTSNSSEPTWPDADGGGVIDNTAEWTEITGAWYLRLPNLYGITAPATSMEPDFKELDLGDRTVDKVLKRADVSAFFSVRQRAWMELVGNGGQLRFFAGPCTIGGHSGLPTDRRESFSELGSFILGSGGTASGPSEEFQARQMTPSGVSPKTSSTPTTATVGVVRARALQPKFRDGSGFLIDSSNDYIVWCSINGLTGAVDHYQAQITNGYYTNVNQLLQAVVDAMNNANVQLAGFDNLPAPQWSYSDCFAAAAPYMTQLNFKFDARNAGVFVAFLCKEDRDESITDANGTVYYVGRCQRLLAMLGYDTGPDYRTALGADIQIGNSDVNVVGEQSSPTLASPTKICGVHAIPYLRSAAVVVDDLQVDLVVKGGRPMGHANSKS